jgi:hypothetical protein
MQYSDGHTALEGWLAPNHEVPTVQSRMNVILTQGDNVILFDICVSNPAGQTFVNQHRSALIPLAAAAVASKSKKDKFLKVYPLNTNLGYLNASFVPIALETTEAIGQESLAYLDNMVKSARLRPNAGAVKAAYSTFHSRVVIIMARARAASIKFLQANIKRSAILASNNAAAYYFLYDVDDDD